MVSKIFDKITKCAYFGEGIPRLRKLSYPVYGHGNRKKIASMLVLKN